MATVVVVDDEHPITSLLQDALEDEGHTVIVARDGHEGLALAHTQAPAVVLPDNMMPNCNGPALVQALLADPSMSHMVLIMISATHVPGLAALTTVAFLPKPFSPSLFPSMPWWH